MPTLNLSQHRSAHLSAKSGTPSLITPVSSSKPTPDSGDRISPQTRRRFASSSGVSKRHIDPEKKELKRKGSFSSGKGRQAVLRDLMNTEKYGQHYKSCEKTCISLDYELFHLRILQI